MPKLKHWGTIWFEPLVLAHVVMVAVGIHKAKALGYYMRRAADSFTWSELVP